MGFDEQEAAHIAGAALTAAVLDAADPAHTNRSQLGAPRALPAHVLWPEFEGRPLTFLASIALEELPETDDRETLPCDGTLLFFAQLTQSALSIASSRAGAIRVIHVGRNESAETRTVPAGGRELSRLRVVPRPVLTLPGASTFGLRGANERRYERVVSSLEAAQSDPSIAEEGQGSHQVFGHPRLLQDDPRDPGQTLVLQIHADPRLGLSYQDAGAIYFLATREVLRGKRWNAVVASDAAA